MSAEFIAAIVKESAKRRTARNQEFKRLINEESLSKDLAKKRAVEKYPYPTYENEFLKELIRRERDTCNSYFSHLGRVTPPRDDAQRAKKRERERERKKQRRDMFKQQLEKIKEMETEYPNILVSLSEQKDQK